MGIFKGKICINCHKKIGFLSNAILILKDDTFRDHDIYVCSDKCKNEITKKAEKQFDKNREYYNRIEKEYLCEGCDYRWISRKSFGVPAICPKCKNENITKYTKTKEWEENYVKQKNQHIKEIFAYLNFEAREN